ncbi:MAG: tRNA pseudouridine(55) synthase TruB [Nitrospinaceae bacterium]|jgi:tRNA pseudouridine55 synthase|nr:MAG: tRNA pseudouridine(55) synthase TruB [Nitrospinaceae bacterium]
MSYTQDSILNLFKPKGLTSFQAVNRVKRRLQARKAGHIGTLDPMAEGVLPICLNRATRIIQFLSPLKKVYRAELVLGAITDTQDATGKVLEQGDPGPVTAEMARRVVEGFLGEQLQVPPMFSAKKNKGIPLYKLARNGITIDRKPVSICVHRIDFLQKTGDRVEFEVECSAGTYVRTLCHDMGRRLGCGAHMTRLVRTRVGMFDLENALTLEAFDAAAGDGSLPQKLFPQERALDFLPEIRVKKDFVSSLANGLALSKSSLETFPPTFRPGMDLRVMNGGDHLLAVVEPVVDEAGLKRLEPEDIAFKLKRVLV